MRNIFLSLFFILFMSLIVPVESYAAVDVESELKLLGQSLGTVEYKYKKNDIEYTKKITYYAGAHVNDVVYDESDTDFYLILNDNTEYANYYSNVPNPHQIEFFCVTKKDRAWVTMHTELIWTDANGALQSIDSFGRCSVTTAFGQATSVLNVYDKSSTEKEYVEQFIGTDDTYENFKSFFENSGYNYGTLSATVMDVAGYDYSCNISLPFLKIKSGLIPETAEEDSESKTIWSNQDGGGTGIGTSKALPFLYCPPGSDEPPYIDQPQLDGEYSPSNAKDFICYREHKKPFISLSSHRKGTSIFTWKVEDYPEFANCFIEIRSTLLQGDSISGYKLLTDDFYYYSSVDSSLKKDAQSSILKIPFSAGTAICAEKDMGDYFTSLEEFKNIAVSCPIRMQVRVSSEDKQVYSNWVTFDFGTDGQHLQTGLLDDNGNVIVEDLSSIPDYDWNSDNNAGKYDYYVDGVSQNSTGSSGFDADFSGWLDSALASVIRFPSLLSICYSWLPPEIITLIGIGIGMLIVLRLLGR